MRYDALHYKSKVIKSPNEINRILIENNFEWLLDCEIENANFEIRNNTIIWNYGNLYSGNWIYGIWKNGVFHGTFENGIFENGDFKGKFISGIKLTDISKN